MKAQESTPAVQTGTYKQFNFRDLKPNLQNPRRLFDPEPLKVLEESIRQNGILVPLTVYRDTRSAQHYILDGERRWRCAELIETDSQSPQQVPIPANVVDPPTPVANILWMFNIHNLREQWELMPTALSLKIVMTKLKEDDDRKLAEITKLSIPHVKRCKMLLSYPAKYQEMMLLQDPSRRIKANFFIELHPVLDLYLSLPNQVRDGKDRLELIDHFLDLYRNGKIPSVIHFRKILEAYDCAVDAEETDPSRLTAFGDAATALAQTNTHSIRQLFDPLIAGDKKADSAETACKDFLKAMRQLKPDHVTRRSRLQQYLTAIRTLSTELLTKLEG